MEFSFAFRKRNVDCCLRVAGLAKIVTDRQVKTKLAGHCSFFSEHLEGVDDPDRTVPEIPIELVSLASRRAGRDQR